jgi:hypothetical protein
LKDLFLNGMRSATLGVEERQRWHETYPAAAWTVLEITGASLRVKQLDVARRHA